MLGAGCGAGGVAGAWGRIGPAGRGGGGIESAPEKGPGWVDSVAGRLATVGPALLGRWAGATLPPPQADSSESAKNDAEATQRIDRTRGFAPVRCDTESGRTCIIGEARA